MARRQHNAQRRGREGQAMAEFLVGLVCIMLLLVGLQQASFLSQAGFKAMTNARHAAAEQYVHPSFNEWPRFNFSAPTLPGPDGKTLTADDRRIAGDDSFYQDNDGYLIRVYDGEISGYLELGGQMDPNSDLRSSGGVYSSSGKLDMIHASDQQSVEVVPFLDKVLGRDRILIGRDVWMPKWDGIK